MQNEEQKTTLIRSENIENLDFESDNQNGENGAVGNLHNINNDGRFFDSRDYRVCFNLVHAKILTFVLSTWVLHINILSSLYLLSIYEETDKSTIYIILLCRVVQIITIGILYYGLWKNIKKTIFPFIVSQFTLGIFGDISTLLILIRQFERDGDYPLFEGNLKWLNVVFPLILYFSIVALLIYVLYICYKFLDARSLHDKRRQIELGKIESNFGLNGSGAGFTRNDAVMPNTDSELRTSSPLLTQKTQNAIAMHSLSRTPSSQLSMNPRSTKLTAEQMRQKLLNQRSNGNPTGSLQQLTSFSGRQSFVATSRADPTCNNQRRLISMSNSPYPRANYDQSEPTLHLMSTKNNY